MRFRISWKMALIVLALVATLVAWFAYQRLAPFVSDLDAVLVGQLTKELNRAVSIESARVVSRNQVVITGLKVAQGKSFDEGVLLTAKSVTAEVDVVRIATGRGSVARNVRSVTLVDPEISLVRDPDGVWNIGDLLKRPPTPPAERFKGVIHIESGRLMVTDHSSLLARGPAVNTVTSIGGSIDYRSGDTAQVDLAGQGAQGRIGKLTLRGPLGLGDPRLTKLEVGVTGANAGYWLDYFSTIRSWTLHEGVVDGKASISRTPEGEFTAGGTATFRKDSITSPRLTIPLRQVTGSLSFVGAGVRFQADARLRGSPVHAAGTVTTGQTLNIRVTSDAMDPLTLQQTIRGLPAIPDQKWPTLLSFDATIFGSADKPSVRATTSIPRAVVFGLPASRINASGTYSNGIITLRGGLDAGRGTIRTSGTISASGRLNLAVNAAGVNLETLLGPLGYHQASGIADFDGRLTGTTSSPLLTGDLIARDGRFQQTEFDLVRARATVTRGYLLLTDATVRRHGDEIATTGFIRIVRGAPAQIDLRARGKKLSLAELARLTGLKIEAEGSTDVDLRIAGRYPDLLAEGHITLTDATIAGHEVDYARVNLRTVDGRTRIEQLVATSGEMKLNGSGYVGPKDALSISIAGENLDLSLLNPSLSPYVVLSGSMTFTGTVSGTLANPIVRGGLVSSWPVVNQTAFDRLAGNISWDGSTLSLLDASLTRADVLYSMPAFQLDTRTDSIVLDTSIGSERLDRLLALLRNSPYLLTAEGEALRDVLDTVPPDASGRIDATLSLSGPIKDLSGEGTVTGSQMAFGPTRIDSAQLDFAVEQSILYFHNMGLKSPGVDLDATGGATTFTANARETQVGTLLALIEGAPFLPAFEFGQELISISESVPKPTSGTLNVAVDLTDMEKGGTGTISARIADLSLDDQAVGQVTAEARLIEGTVSIEQFDIAGPMGTADFTGDISRDQVASITGKVKGMPLSLLGPMLGVPELSGTLNAALRMTGPFDDPSVQATLDAANVTTPQVSFDSITVTDLVIGAGKLTVPEVTAVTNGSRILASASLPFSWESPFIPRDQPIDIRATLPEQDLADLARFISEVQSASGTLSMSMAVTGTLDDPVIGGNLAVQNGALRVEGFDSSFQEVQIGATFEGTSLKFDRFTGGSSLGGTFSIEGKVELPSLKGAVLDATFTMDGLRIATDNLTGVYDEKVTMTATGLLNITEGLGAPFIQGDLVVSDAVAEMPAGEIPKPVTSDVVGPSPRFDVTLNLASNVRIERGPLEIEVIGPVSIAGTLALPDIIGTVGLTAGSLRYPGRVFTLVPGGSATFVWQSPDPPSIALDLQATTRAIAQSPFTGRLTRYTIYLDVGGTIDILIISTSSSPPGLPQDVALALIFRQAEIEALLSGVGFEQIVEQQLADTLLGLALPGIFEGIALGALTIGLEPGITVPLQAWVSLQVTDQFSIGYLRTLIAGEPFNVLEATYALSPQYAISAQYQQNQEVLYLLQAGWRF